MSLQTDLIFYDALSADTELMESIGSRLYCTAIPVPDLEAENTSCPYVIVTFDGLNNQDATKDDDFEADSDQVQIGIEIAAETRPKLGELARSVRKTLREYFREHQDDASDEDYQLIPEDMTLSAQPVQYDSLKPCYWQRLQYQCDTKPDDNEQD